ncbi:Class III chitinase [Penicillium cosmopolitanum]|uniref:chitinase n=1 Tax=Penicillium cosmopolitanum TaxID=1131564 RepID=A0A9W9SJ81_9EURO|nr:Class III chitinase [Penicillium cosmopolitanum]KAJ5378960.1 Class III chitinase [Penicillium cosmopolitanum]
MMVNGPGGAPEIDFAVTSQDCEVFEGTQLKHCPKIGEDIKKCQEKGKTILLSIGGATYSEGGFKNEDDAKAGAKLMWETFGPVKEGSKMKRPFDDAALDGFDFDFESSVTHMAPFANELRALINKETDRKYFLTAAPQCPYPDQADKDILNGPVYIDAIWVQFYNNFCGVNNFNKDATSSKYNFEEWDNWAKTVSKNKDVKVIIGVPADTTAASTGYIPADKLVDVIEYSKKFESFGGVMMWDVTQAYANDGFIDTVVKALGDGSGDSGSSSSSNSASTTTSASTSTNSPNTSQSSNAPGSSSSSSSSSASGSSSSEPEMPTPTAETTTTDAPAKPTTTSTTNSATEAAPKPTSTSTSTPTSTSTSTSTQQAAAPTADSTTTAAPATTTTPAAKPAKDDEDNDDDMPVSPDYDPTSDLSDLTKGADAAGSALLGSDLFGLLKGLQQANGPVMNVAQGLTKNLRFARRIQN